MMLSVKCALAHVGRVPFPASNNLAEPSQRYFIGGNLEQHIPAEMKRAIRGGEFRFARFDQSSETP